MKIRVSTLRKLVQEEMDKLMSTEDAADKVEEVEPGDLADTLAKHLDMLKVLKIEESKLAKQLSENKSRQRKIVSKLGK